MVLDQQGIHTFPLHVISNEDIFSFSIWIKSFPSPIDIASRIISKFLKFNRKPNTVSMLFFSINRIQ